MPASLKVMIPDTSRRQLERIMERHGITTYSQAVLFCIAGTYYELERANTGRERAK